MSTPRSSGYCRNKAAVSGSVHGEKRSFSGTVGVSPAGFAFRGNNLSLGLEKFMTARTPSSAGETPTLPERSPWLCLLLCQFCRLTKTRARNLGVCLGPDLLELRF